MSARLARAVVVALAGALALACSGDPASATQIVAVVDSDLAVPGQLERVTIEVDGLTGDALEATADLEERELPRSLTLVHSRGPLGPITVRARGFSGSDEVVERRAIVRFERGESLELRLPLSAACATAELSCRESQTCDRGECVSAEIDDLPAFDGTVDGFDASVHDAGSDASTDAGSGENDPPECTIAMPSDGATFLEGENVTLSGSCNDPEAGPLELGLGWESNRDGSIGNGARVIASTLSTGMHSITFCAADPDEPTLRGCATVELTIEVGAEVTASITSLTQGADAMPPFATGMAIRGMGAGTGAGELRYRWTDSILGVIGESESVSLDAPPKGKHTWTLMVTDARSSSASDSRNFDVLVSGAPLVSRFGDAPTRFDVLAAASNDRVLATGPARRVVYAFDGRNPASVPNTVLDEARLPDLVRDIAIDEQLGYVYFATQGFIVCPFAVGAGIAADQCSEYRGGMLMSDECNAVGRITGSNAMNYLLVGTSRGLLVTSPSTAGNGTATGARRLNNIDIRAILVLGNVAWIATTEGLYSFDPVSNAIDRHAAPSGATSDELRALAAGSDGAIWVGSPNGLGRFVPSTQAWTVWRVGSAPSPGLAADDVRDVAVARTRIGNVSRDVVWVATSNGVSRFDPSIPSFTSFTDDDGLRNNSVRSIAVLSNGSKVLGTDTGVSGYDGL